MRIFVTGGAGYIGSHKIFQLLCEGHSVMSFDNYANSSPESLKRVRALVDGDLQVVEGDVCDRPALDASLQTFAPDAVIHFAGLKAVGESSEEPMSYYRANVFGTIELLDAMQEAGCQRIIFSSSATVYGDAQYLPFDEDHPVNPTNPYGRTKAFAEGIMSDWVAAKPDRSVVLLRYFNPVGADASGQIGEDPNGIPNNLVPYIAKVAAGRLDGLKIFGDDYDTRDGSGERDYIHVSDLADAHLSAIHYCHAHTGCEVFNVGTGQGATVFEMLRAFEKAADRPVPYEVIPRRLGDVARSLAATDKAEKKLRWKAKYEITDMCQSTWNWQHKNPNGYQS
jgi:UDP-glucose 4-epimerase